MSHEARRGATTEGLPVSPTLGPTLEVAHVARRTELADRRVVWLCLLAVPLGAAASAIALGLTMLIALVTNLSYYGRLSLAPAAPAGHALGAWAVLVPVAGGLVVGLMARFGTDKIRGHGIPEAMERVLRHESRIPAIVTFLKPLSAAVAIGTGGPFGAEGPIIATGGALGSLFGQYLPASAAERKTLLAAGAAAGMTATFGTPLSAVLLAAELLLFEFRLRSLVPVAFAAVTAAGMRAAWSGGAPFFALADVAQATLPALAGYAAVGALAGIAAIGVTRAVYAVEDAFDRLPIHWMWWPAIGGIAVGVIGLVAPRTLGVGYDNIGEILSGRMALGAVALLCGLKFVSWALALGSGTSGGTLAPLFTIGGGLGALLGAALAAALPAAGLDVGVAALVGMAALFAGASRAYLASLVFAFETTLAPHALLPLLAACSAAHLVSALGMRTTIMTEKIVRRGVRVPAEYAADFLDQVSAGEVATRPASALRADDSVAHALGWLSSGVAGTAHQGFPVVDAHERLVGIVTRRELAAAQGEQQVRELLQRAPVAIHEDGTLREAADLMAVADVGRLPVLSRAQPERVVGVVSRSDLLAAHRRRLAEAVLPARTRGAS